jgi:hypothetical protein
MARFSRAVEAFGPDAAPENPRMYRVIELHPAAPAKPALNQPCNGCGVCCASEPCPLGVLATGRRQGACAALVWKPDERSHRCGLIEQLWAYLWPWLGWGAPLLRRLALRSIAAGAGCDCSLSVVAPPGAT